MFGKRKLHKVNVDGVTMKVTKTILDNLTFQSNACLGCKDEEKFTGTTFWCTGTSKGVIHLRTIIDVKHGKNTYAPMT